MTEDRELMGLVKAAMEEGDYPLMENLRAIEAFAEQEAQARQAKRCFWLRRSSILVAASFAAAVVLGIFLVREKMQDDVCGVISVLCAVDDIEEDSLSSATTGEMLLAWQDAPCADLLSEALFSRTNP